jgi:cobalt-zinc-cadmium efflux system outer membrane protein
MRNSATHSRRRLTTVTTLTAAFCAAAASGSAQVLAPAPPPTSALQLTFTLADAAVLARQQHPLLLAASGRRQAVTGAARQDAALPNPTLEWRKENLRSPLAPDEFVTAAFPIDLYGRRMVLQSARALTATRALADSSTTARQVEFDVARAYWRTALAFALRDAATAQRLAVDTIALIESDRARQGAVPEGAALRARLEADRARLTEASARAEVERARGDLSRALALPFDSVPRPTESLRIDSAVTLPPIGALLPVARSRRSELLAARARVAEAGRRQLAERLGTFPALGVQVGSKRTSGYQTGTVAVGVAIPLFDRNGGNRERAQGDVLIAQGDLRAVEAAIDADVSAAHRAYGTLLAEYDRTADAGGGTGGLRTLNDRGSRVAAIAATAYREGAIPLFELLDAERVRAEVRVAALRAAVDVHLARLDLLRALGLPIDAATFLPTVQ